MPAQLSLVIVLVACAAVGAQPSNSFEFDSVATLSAEISGSLPNTPDTSADQSNAFTSPQRTFTLERVVVRSQRRARLLAAPQSLSVIENKEWQGSGKNVADIMEEQTAVQTRRYGGTGSFQTVSIRGVPGDHIRVTLDGMPLNSAMGGAVDLGKINPEAIESVEMYKGIAPAALSGNGLGGIIALNSKKGAAASSFNASGSIGSFGYLDQALSFHKTTPGEIRIFGLLSSRHCDNDFPYLDRNNTPYTRTDDTLRLVSNSQYDAFEATGNVAKDWAGNLAGRTTVSYSRSKTGVPGKEGHINETARFSSEAAQITSRLDYTSPGGIRFTPEAGFRLGEDETYWTWKDDFGFSHGGLLPGQTGRVKYRDRKILLAGGLAFYPNEWLGTTARVEATREDLFPLALEGVNAFGDWESKQENILAAADVQMKTNGLGFILGAGAEACRASTSGGNDPYSHTDYPAGRITDVDGSFRAGLHHRIGGTGTLFANAARYHRFPALRERYGSRGGVLANPKIGTERGYNYDIGLKWLSEILEMEFTAFRIESRNAVIMLPDGRAVKPINIGASMSQGLESVLRYKQIDFFSFQLSGTLQKAVCLSHLYGDAYYGKELPNEPRLSLFARTGLGPVGRFDIQYETDFKSAYYRDPGNTQKIPEKGIGSLFHHVRLRYKPVPKIEVIASALNITNFSTQYDDISQDFESGYSWVLYPGREYRLSVYLSR